MQAQAQVQARQAEQVFGTCEEQSTRPSNILAAGWQVFQTSETNRDTKRDDMRRPIWANSANVLASTVLSNGAATQKAQSVLMTLTHIH
jgi:hypothetical protein